MTKDVPQMQDKAPEKPKPLTLRETFSILLAGHIGVRKAKQREEDFRRANGLHIFIASALYFSAIVTGLVLLVRYLSQQ